jgi:protein phosphatase
MVQMTDDVLQGDVFLLCSDGLTDMLSDEEISKLFEQNADADVLCNAAIEAGGIDNVSCCVISVK